MAPKFICTVGAALSTVTVRGKLAPPAATAIGEMVRICGEETVKFTLAEFCEAVVTETGTAPALTTSMGGTPTSSVLTQFMPVGHGGVRTCKGVRLSVPKCTTEEPFIFVPETERMNAPSPAGMVDGDMDEITGIVDEFEFEPQPPERMRQTVRSVLSSTNLCRIP